MGYVNIGREAAEEFQAGQGSISIFPEPVLAANMAAAVLKYVIIRADAANPGNLYVGPSTVVVGAGFRLDAGDETPPIHIDSLAKVYVVSDVSGTDEEQTVAIDNATTSGDFTLSHGGYITGPIDWNANAATVKGLIDAMGPEYDVSVTGGPGPGTDWVVTFSGSLASQDIVNMVGDGTNLVGGLTTVTVTQTVLGVEAPQSYSWLAV
jgi:hypothetical protein